MTELDRVDETLHLSIHHSGRSRTNQQRSPVDKTRSSAVLKERVYMISLALVVDSNGTVRGWMIDITLSLQLSPTAMKTRNPRGRPE